MPTAQEAAAHVSSLNSRHRRPIPAWMKERATPVYIFNIYQRAHTVLCGSLGRFAIPACEPGKTYSEPLIVPGFIADEYDLGDGNGNMSYEPLQGSDVAAAIVGTLEAMSGFGLYTTNREWWGVFIAKGETPTKDELAEAHKKLTRMMTALLQRGDQLALQGPKGIADIGPNERSAAVWLNQRRDWAALPQQMDNCPACGTPIKPGVAVCSHCPAIIDPVKAAKYGIFAPQQEAPTPPTRK